MASITKVGPNRYRVRWRDGGRGSRARSRTVHSLAAARDLARGVDGAKDRGLVWEPANGVLLPELPDLFEAYIRDGQARGKYVRTVVTGLDRFLDFLRSRRPQGRLFVGELTRSAVVDFVALLRDEGKSASTIQHYVGAVHRAWAWAADQEEWEEQVPRPRRVELPSIPAARTIAPTWDEMDRVIGAAGLEPLRRVLLLQRCTGLRVGQVLRLDWQDFDLDAQRLHVRPELGKSRAEKAGRYVPVAPALVPVLKAWGPLPEGSLVGKSYVRNADVAQAWRTAAVDPRKWQRRSTHAFRKGFVSGLRKAGADPDAVEFLVGHTLGLVGVYTDPDSLPLVEAVALVPEVPEHLYRDEAGALAEVVPLRVG